MLHVRRLFSVGIIVFCLLLCAGCGGSSKGGALKGTVVLPSYVKVAQNDSAMLTFVPEGEENSQGFSSQINPDLSFVAKGPTGKGIPPGKYKIVFHYQPYKPGDAKQKRFVEGINKRFDVSSSRMTYEVTADPQQSIAIDLDKGTVTKQ